jgi:acetyl esterase/lipase
MTRIASKAIAARIAGLAFGLGLAATAAAQPPQGLGAPQPPPAISKATIQIGPATAMPSIAYATPPGHRPLMLDLYRPTNPSGPLPMVLWLHGGGWGAGDPRGGAFVEGDWSQSLAELAGRGYLVASATYQFVSEAKYPAQAQDVRSAIRWLRRNAATYGGSSNKLVVMGGSAGAYLSLVVGMSCGDPSLDPPRAGPPGSPPPPPPPAGSECVDGVVAFYPPTDLVTLAQYKMPGPNPALLEGLVENLLGCRMSACPPSQIQAANILGRIDAKDPPVLIFHGEADTLVPISHSQTLDAALKRAGVPSELVVVPGRNHAFPGLPAADRARILEQTFRFIDERTGRRP